MDVLGGTVGAPVRRAAQGRAKPSLGEEGCTVPLLRGLAILLVQLWALFKSSHTYRDEPLTGKGLGASSAVLLVETWGCARCQLIG